MGGGGATRTLWLQGPCRHPIHRERTGGSLPSAGYSVTACEWMLLPRRRSEPNDDDDDDNDRSPELPADGRVSGGGLLDTDPIAVVYRDSLPG